MSTFEVPFVRCRVCDNGLIEASAVLDDQAPNPGDFSVCKYCHTLSVFDDALNLVPPTEEQCAEFVTLVTKGRTRQ